MLHIAICEDTPEEARYIEMLLSRYGAKRSESGFSAVTEYFGSGRELLEAIERGEKFDLYLLDILMPGMDGIVLGRTLRSEGWREPILYLTSSAEYAVEAYSVRAKNYLLKPVTEKALFDALDELLPSFFPKAEKTARIATTSGECSLPLSQICYVEVTGHTLHYHLADGRVFHSKVLRIPFEQATRELQQDPRFLRPHQSYLVNADHVSRLTARDMLMTDGTQIPISRLRINDTRKAYMDHLAEAGAAEGGPRAW